MQTGIPGEVGRRHRRVLLTAGLGAEGTPTSGALPSRQAQHQVAATDPVTVPTTPPTASPGTTQLSYVKT
jgi:hypothetical protein